MRNFLFLLLLSSVSVNAQESAPVSNYNDFLASSSGGLWTKSSSKVSKVKGSTYLLDKWKNSSKIYGIDNRVQRIPFLNYNLKTKNFETRLLKTNGITTNYASDSVYVFDSNTINKVLINNREFVKVKNSKTGKKEFMEFISKTGNTSLYKNHLLKIEEGKLNPLTQQSMSADKFVKKPVYYLKDNDGLKEIKMRKGKLLKLFVEHKKAINIFINEHGLNLKNDYHIKRVFNYYNSL
ncbi:MAG: hypothetical protein COA88_06705 [Kordia sp.]|nr:MAG: hypothetical protein COA88_06705 [Kordia sp.]